MSTPSTASTPDIMNPDDHPLAAATVTRFINHGTPGMTGQSSGCKRSWRKRRESWIPLARRFGSSPRDVGLGVSPVVSNKCVANNPKCWFHFRIFQGPRNLNMFFFPKNVNLGFSTNLCWLAYPVTIIARLAAAVPWVIWPRHCSGPWRSGCGDVWRCLSTSIDYVRYL
jgi:hypothetical protein